MVVFTCDLSTQEEETGRLDVEGQPGLYETLSLKQTKQNRGQQWDSSISRQHSPPHLSPSLSSRDPLQMFAMKSSLEDMDALELDFRMRLAEVQRRYKEKQRELVKLQRRRDSG
jgi:hypothetical protein